jgi:hypothetical protein
MALEQERRKRWLMVLALCSRATLQLDFLVWDRNSRGEDKVVDRAARLIQRKHAAKQMRKQLLLLNKSVQVLRNNVMRFAFEWKLRKKRRSADMIQEFLSVVSGKSKMQRTVHNFVHKVIKVQRKWRRYATIIAAQLGVFLLQFDKLLRAKRSADMHLTADEHKQWTKKLSKLLLEKANTQNRAGQRDAKRQAKAKAEGEAEAEEGGADEDAEVAAGEGDDDTKGKGKVKDAKAKDAKGGTPSAAGPDSSRFAVIDLDCKLLALSRCLRRRKTAFRKQMNEYEVEFERSKNMIVKYKEMEEMRRMVSSPRADRRVRRQGRRDRPRSASGRLCQDGLLCCAAAAADHPAQARGGSPAHRRGAHAHRRQVPRRQAHRSQQVGGWETAARVSRSHPRRVPCGAR